MREYKEDSCIYGASLGIFSRDDIEYLKIGPNSIVDVSKQKQGLHLVAGGVLLILSVRGEEYFVVSRRTETAPFSPNHISIYEGGILFDNEKELLNPTITAYREFAEELVICQVNNIIHPKIKGVNNIDILKQNIEDLKIPFENIVDVNVEILDTSQDQNFLIVNNMNKHESYGKFRAIKIIENDALRMGITKVIRMNFECNINDLRFYDCERHKGNILNREVRLYKKHKNYIDGPDNLCYEFSNIRGERNITNIDCPMTIQLSKLLISQNVKIS